MSKIFLQNVPNKILYELLEKVATKYHSFYDFDVNSYNQMKYRQYIEPFIDSIMPYYKKTEYLLRPMTMKSITTILRQICRYNNIQIKCLYNYNKSHYFIHLQIYKREGSETVGF
jgi:hypothetical protein